MGAPPKANYPTASPEDLVQYDGYLLGIAARYGGWPAQFKSFWDSTGQLWTSGALAGKLAAAFVSTGAQGGGQESAYFSIMTALVHHGLVFVPLGYYHTTALWQGHADEVHGGSPFGAGTLAVGRDGVTDIPVDAMNRIQGQIPFASLPKWNLKLRGFKAESSTRLLTVDSLLPLNEQLLNEYFEEGRCSASGGEEGPGTEQLP